MISEGQYVVCTTETDGLAVGQAYRASDNSGRYDFLDHKEFVKVIGDNGALIEVEIGAFQ